MIRPVLAACSALLLGACASQQLVEVQPIDGVISGQCHTDMVRGAVGLAASLQTVERARIDSDSLAVEVVDSERVTGGATASGLADPQQGASSSGGDTLTIERGPTNNITAVYCGQATT